MACISRECCWRSDDFDNIIFLRHHELRAHAASDGYLLYFPKMVVESLGLCQDLYFSHARNGTNTPRLSVFCGRSHNEMIPKAFIQDD